jgi:hypothetical protein
MIIPMTGDVLYLTAEGESVCFHATVERIAYALGHVDETVVVQMKNQLSLVHLDPFEPLKEPIPLLFRFQRDPEFALPKAHAGLQRFAWEGPK